MGLCDTSAFARAALPRIKLAYLWRHGRLPDLRHPTRFTELVQLRKLADRDPRLPLMADKIAAKQMAAERLGQEWVIPLLWTGDTLPDRPSWKKTIILKSRHGCNQNVIIDAEGANWSSAARLGRSWMGKHYGAWLDEWLYSQIPRGLLIEPFIGSDRALPVDYKIYVFGGQATHVQTHLDRGTNHRWVVHDTSWRPLSVAGKAIKRPSALSAMIAASEELGRDFPFVRVDFYQPAAQPLFGEMTFYPGSGLDPFEPANLNVEMGRLWLDARVEAPLDQGAMRITGTKLAA